MLGLARLGVLWVLASVGAWAVFFPIYPVNVPLAGLLAALLHGRLLARHLGGAWPEAPWIRASVVGWSLAVAALALLLLTPLGGSTERELEGRVLVGLLVAGLAVGLAQWTALRATGATPLWAVFPGVGLFAALALSVPAYAALSTAAWLHAGIESDGAMFRFAVPLGLSLSFGIWYGIVTGVGISLALLLRRPPVQVAASP